MLFNIGLLSSCDATSIESSPTPPNYTPTPEGNFENAFVDILLEKDENAAIEIIKAEFQAENMEVHFRILANARSGLNARYSYLDLIGRDMNYMLAYIQSQPHLLIV